MTRIVPMQDFDYQPEFKEVTTTISSNRLDTFTAAACNMSRGQTSEYIRSDQVFINGRLCNDVNHRLNDGDVISFRGKGKVVFDGVLGNTKKEKLRIRYRWYQ
jgi:RNA-binding protein YlmH